MMKHCVSPTSQSIDSEMMMSTTWGVSCLKPWNEQEKRIAVSNCFIILKVAMDQELVLKDSWKKAQLSWKVEKNDRYLFKRDKKYKSKKRETTFMTKEKSSEADKKEGST